MKAISVLLAAGLLIPAFGQTGVIAEGNVGGSGYVLYWQTRLDPPSPPLANSLGHGSNVNDKTGNIYRVMIDRVTRSYFGYEVKVEPLAARNEYRMTFHPLDLSAKVLQQLHIDDPTAWTRKEIGVTALPAVLVNGATIRPGVPDNLVRVGGIHADVEVTVHTVDVIAVDLMVNQDTKQKIVDYVALQEPNRGWSFGALPPVRREFAYTPGNARDFSVADAQLRLLDPSLAINGKVEENLRDDIKGPILWVSLPNRGRYLLSIVPQPGFVKAGEVRGTSLTFRWSGDRYTIASSGPIAPGDAPFNLYVRPEAGWKPANPGSRVMFGAMERPEAR